MNEKKEKKEKKRGGISRGKRVSLRCEQEGKHRTIGGIGSRLVHSLVLDAKEKD